jgi:hypothetical protein
MRFTVLLDVGSLPRIQVAAAKLTEGHTVVRHYYRTGVAAEPRARWVTHLTRYECSCGLEWHARKPATCDVEAHLEDARA